MHASDAADERIVQRRTAGALRKRAAEFLEVRERAAARKKEAERRRLAAEAEKARRVRLDTLKRRGDGVWREIETEIERRNPTSYERAIGLLSDLQALAAEEGSEDEFDRHLAAIHARHEKKGRFIERPAKIGRGADERLV